MCPVSASSEEKFKLSSEDMVTIRADQAWEDVEPDTMHFAGNFQMHIREWKFNADSASLFGRIDNPDRLELKGSPARINITHTQGKRTEEVQGEALEIVYDRSSDTITLGGGARLVQGENIMQSNAISYDLGTDRIHATGEGGVQINLNTEDSEKTKN